MEQIIVYAFPSVRVVLKEILEEKGITCTGFSGRDPYIKINLGSNSFYSFGEVKGQKYIYLASQYLTALRLLPKEAIITFLLDVAR